MFYTNNQTDRHQGLFTSDVAHQNTQQTKQPQTVYIIRCISELLHLLESKHQDIVISYEVEQIYLISIINFKLEIIVAIKYHYIQSFKCYY